MRLYRFAGLFLFEFVVVLLGVLAAQAVGDWADDRRLAREAEAQFQLAREQAIRAARVQQHWASVGPCLIDRARAVALAAARGETISAAAIGRPALPPVGMPSWDEDVRRAAMAHIGRRRMNAIANAEGVAWIMQESTIGIRDGWSTFALLDPAGGPPSDIDRGNVRIAAVEVIDKIRVLKNNELAAQMEALDVAHAEWGSLDLGRIEVDSCGLVKDWR